MLSILWCAFGSLRQEFGDTSHVHSKCSRGSLIGQPISADIPKKLECEIVLVHGDLPGEPVHSAAMSLTLASPFQLTTKRLARHRPPIQFFFKIACHVRASKVDWFDIARL